MDRYFYSVETDGDHKVVHMFGNVYYNDSDETNTCFRCAEWTFLYITLEKLKELVSDVDVFWNYLNERVNYLEDLTEKEALEVCREYFGGAPGRALDIRLVNENTPCGDYWFE